MNSLRFRPRFRPTVLMGLISLSLWVSLEIHQTRAHAQDELQSDEAPTSAVLVVRPRLDINVASVDELIALPGIGESRAAAIITRRERRPFRRIRELLRIRGIGPRLYRRLREHLRVAPRAPVRGR